VELLEKLLAFREGAGSYCQADRGQAVCDESGSAAFFFCSAHLHARDVQ